MDVERLLGHHLLQPPVFVFQLAELLHIADFQPSIFGPARLREGGIRDAVLSTDSWTPMLVLQVSHYGNDLFLRVPFPCHSAPPVEPITSFWIFPSDLVELSGGRSLNDRADVLVCFQKYKDTLVRAAFQQALSKSESGTRQMLEQMVALKLVERAVVQAETIYRPIPDLAEVITKPMPPLDHLEDTSSGKKAA